MSTTTVEAVAIKLPPFWTSCPEAWFAQAEAQFIIRKISKDETKYSYVVAALDTTAATRALAVLQSPPTTGKYEHIKKYLISAFGLTDSERAAALFKVNGLGDSKSSELMDNMLSLLGNHNPCFLFKHLFMQQLPEYVRTPLSSSSETDCRKLAQEADKYYASGRPVHLSSVSVDVVRRPKSTLPRDTPVPGICWYHRRFGNRAKTCVAPCQFQPATPQQGN